MHMRTQTRASYHSHRVGVDPIKLLLETFCIDRNAAFTALIKRYSLLCLLTMEYSVWLLSNHIEQWILVIRSVFWDVWESNLTVILDLCKLQTCTNETTSVHSGPHATVQWERPTNVQSTTCLTNGVPEPTPPALGLTCWPPPLGNLIHGLLESCSSGVLPCSPARLLPRSFFCLKGSVLNLFLHILSTGKSLCHLLTFSYTSVTPKLALTFLWSPKLHQPGRTACFDTSTLKCSLSPSFQASSTAWLWKAQRQH